ncbi:MAG TPA: O-antigen ligase family protein [Candidatus Limnocylindrales bacterium]|nr:O-antigen ligase family protein [Candidatus Limnocylindrales bacterium]
MFRKVLEIGLVAAVALAVAGFGGTEPVSWALSQDFVFLLAAALILNPAKALAGSRSISFWGLAALATWIAFQWLAARQGKIGLDAHSIETHGLTFAAGIAGFFVAMEVARDRAARRRLATSLIALALFEAAYGLAQYPGGWQFIWSYRRKFYTGSATGTYINHNHFAGLLEMILPLCLALAFYHWGKAAGSRSRSFAARLGEPDALKSLVLVLSAILLFVAIVFSFSRMGLISACASLAVLAALGWPRHRRSRVDIKLVVACLAVSVAVAAWVGPGPVVEHFERLSHDEPLAAGSNEGRMALWRDAAKLIRAHPWGGSGLGCFEFAFTRVQSTQLALLIDHAHNDYLELTVELGLPAAALFFALLFFAVARSLRAATRAESRLNRAIGAGAAAGAIALLIHSTADFNLYIPANMLVFAVVLAIGCSIPLKQPAAEATADLRHQRVRTSETSSTQSVPAI